MMGRRVARTTLVLAAFAAAWVIMNERLTLVTVLSGVVFAVIVLLLTDRLAGDEGYGATYLLTPGSTLAYAALLAREITTAAWAMAKVILRGTGEAREFVYHSKLHDELHLYLLANAIILTPGSVAVARCGTAITVVSADPDLARARAACQRLERHIAKYRRL